MAKAKAKGSVDGKKVFLFTLGAGIITGAGFLAYEHFKNKKQPENGENPQGPDALPASQPVQGNDSFPLKIGSRGQRVVQLQQKLAKILGADKLSRLTPIDGIWGKGTQAAVKLAGLPLVISEAAFNSIVSAKGGAVASGLQQGIQKISASSLSGFSENKDIITLAPTFVIDGMGNRILVKKNVILGSAMLVSNGMTRFRGIDGQVASVPASDVRQV